MQSLTGRSTTRALSGLTILLLTMTAAPAQDWPQWRGAHRDGKATDTGLLQEWPEGGPRIAWRTHGLGEGYSSISIRDGRILTMGDLPDGQYVMALRLTDGEPLWKTRGADRARLPPPTETCFLP